MNKLRRFLVSGLLSAFVIAAMAAQPAAAHLDPPGPPAFRVHGDGIIIIDDNAVKIYNRDCKLIRNVPTHPGGQQARLADSRRAWQTAGARNRDAGQQSGGSRLV